MNDVIEFYKDGGNFGSVNSSMVPPVGSKISIKGIVHKVISVTYAFCREGREMITEGPWTAHDFREDHYLIKADGVKIAMVYQIGVAPFERVPNALAISAVPEMLALTEAVCKRLSGVPEHIARLAIEAHSKALPKSTEPKMTGLLWSGDRAEFNGLRIVIWKDDDAYRAAINGVSVGHRFESKEQCRRSIGEFLS